MCRAVLLTWQWDSEVMRRFHGRTALQLGRKAKLAIVTFVVLKHPMDDGARAGQTRCRRIDCYQVIRELSDYLEADLTPQLRLQIESHLKNCAHCMAVYDGLRNVVRLLGDEKAIELPEGFSERLYKRLNGSNHESTQN